MQENGFTIGGAQENYQLGFGHVNAFIEHVYGQDVSDFSGFEQVQASSVFFVAQMRVHGHGARNELNKVLGMINALTKDHGFHVLVSQDLVSDFLIALFNENGFIELLHADLAIALIDQFQESLKLAGVDMIT